MHFLKGHWKGHTNATSSWFICLKKEKKNFQALKFKKKMKEGDFVP